MVHGWRKYDMSQAISTAPFHSASIARSTISTERAGEINHSQKNKLKDIALSVIVKKGRSIHNPEEP